MQQSEVGEIWHELGRRYHAHIETGCAEARPADALVLRRLRAIGLISMLLIVVLTFGFGAVLGAWQIPAVGVGLLAFFLPAQLLAPRFRGRLARPLAHGMLASATLGIGIAIPVTGTPAPAGIYLHTLVILAAAHSLGRRAALGWTLVSLPVSGLAMALTPAMPMPEGGLAIPPAVLLGVRWLVLLSVLGYAVAARFAEDQQSARLEALACQDPLTGLANRRELFRRLEEALLRARRFGRRGAFLYIDLDRFKPINDELGHHVGDDVLCEAARRLAGETRRIDLAARLGGDEFGVLLCEVNHEKGEDVFARRLLELLAAPLAVSGRRVSVGASIGVVRFPEEADGPDEVSRRADAAMYEAKREGGSRVFHWTPAGCQRVD